MHASSIVAIATEIRGLGRQTGSRISRPFSPLTQTGNEAKEICSNYPTETMATEKSLTFLEWDSMFMSPKSNLEDYGWR